MDPNIQQPQQSVASQVIQQQVQQNVPTKSLFPKILLSILGVIIVLGLIGVAYYLGVQKNTPVVSNGKATEENVTLFPTNTPTTLQSSEVVNVDSTYTKYINHALGFSITYPKVAGNPNCTTGQPESSPLSILEDLSNNSLYLTFLTQSYQMQIQKPDGTYASGGPGFNCKTVSVTVANILSGVDNGFPNNAWFHPINYHFQYAQITNDNDLLTLGEKGLQETGCTGIQKTLIGNNVYSVSIQAPYNNGNPSPTCFLNFKYKFLYNAQKHLGIVWGEGQAPAWQMNGKVYDVTVDFPNN